MDRIDRWLDDRLNAIAALLDKCSKLFAALLMVCIVLIGIGTAAHRLLWYDELVTVFTASLPSTSAVWRFYAAGLDTTGPVQSLVARAGMHLPLPAELSARIPFILAFACMSLGIYGFVRRRYPAGFALASLALPLLFSGLCRFMTEARAYALVLGCIGIAMYCWQAAADGRARPWALLGLWLALASAIAAHFFAVFTVVPFGAAQLVHDRQRKRVDWPAWTAFVLSPAGFLPFLRGAINAGHNYASTFHARPSLRSFASSYRTIYISYAWVEISVLLLVALWFVHRYAREGGEQAETGQASTEGFTPAEWVFASVLLLLPVYMVVAAMTVGVYRDQYALPFYIGLVLLVVATCAELVRREPRAGALVMIVVLLPVAVVHAKAGLSGCLALAHPERIHASAVARVANRPWVRRLTTSSLPMVLDSNSYMDLAYYGTPQERRQVFALVDGPDRGDPRFRASLSNQENFILFSRMLPVLATEADDFIARNPHFLVLTHFDRHEWVPIYLMDREIRGELAIRLLSQDEDGAVLDVELSRPSPGPSPSSRRPASVVAAARMTGPE